ncbi:hypothetical protein CFAM422_003627 [Trichoderma lentiforme]|uniref:Nephrocystin 3-like N-terminal domain-containing protein n=1 Tax=Trichoderma lentiforme TaxID=1567552 RepID=A0A9P4XMF4_9HYPO|nr:hypothetical protein CFAM422_003627 [Trichoderma lentiforme]
MDGKNQKRQAGNQFLTETGEHVINKKPRIEPYDTDNVTTNFSGQGIQHTGQGPFTVGGNVIVTTTNVAPTIERDNCLRGLFITDPSDDRTALKRKKGNRVSGTCKWILETEEVAAWLGQGEMTSNVLWIYGNPGIGKSTMAIFLTEELPTAFNKTNKTLAYFFCNSSFDKQKTATSVVRGLLLQLVQQHPRLLDHHVLPKYKERRSELFKSFNALWKIFLATATDQNIGQTYCIVNALDKCDQESQDILLHQLKDSFQNQHQVALLNIRILITSRPYPEIREFLQVFINKDLASSIKIREDINRYIQAKVAYLAIRKNYTKSVQQTISSILRDKAESTFLWIGLACEQLEKFLAKDAIRVLLEMPKGLHSLYRSLLDTALEGSEEVYIIRRILGLVAVCARPLSLLELSEACQLYEDEDMETRVQFTRDQIASCRLMVIVQDEKVLLLHQSFYRKERFYRREHSHIYLLSYATKHWTHHAYMAQSSFKIRDSEAEFFGLNSSAREQWLETLRGEQYSIPKQFSILHVAARWGIVALVDYIAGPNHAESSIETTMSLPDLDSITSDGRTPLEEAIRSENPNVVSRLLFLGVKITKRAIEAAARSSVEIMQMLLEQRRDEINITKKFVSAAECNSKNGKQIMALLIQQRGDKIAASKKTTSAIAKEFDKDMMEFLLDQHGDKVIITGELVKATAQNYKNGKEIMTLLLEQRGDEIAASESTMSAVAERFDMEAMQLLLDQHGDKIVITEELVEGTAQNYKNRKEIMTLLLEQRGDEIAASEESISIMAEKFDKKMMELLLSQHGDKITITEEVVTAAARNKKNGKEIMALLLSQRGNEITITEEVVEAAAENCLEVIELLLDRRGNEITVTEAVVTAAAGNCLEVIELLLDRRGNEITITENVLQSAAYSDNWKEIIALLLNRRGNEITITEEVVTAAADAQSNSWDDEEDMITFMLSQRGDMITEEVVKAAVRYLRKGNEIIASFLGQQGNKITNIEEMVKAAAKGRNGKEVIELLLNRQGNEITITEEVVKAAVKSYSGYEVIELLLDRRGNEITITQDVVKAAAEYYDGKEVIELLLNRRGNEITITEDVVKAAVKSYSGYGGYETIQFLLDQRGNEITITEDVVKAAADALGSDKIMELLLDRRGNEITMTEELLITAARRKKTLKLLLNRRGNEIIITEGVVKAAARSKEAIQLLLDRRGNEIIITEGVVKAAAQDKEVIQLLLDRRGNEITITEEVIKAAAGSFRGNKTIKLLLNRRGHEITITEEVIKAAAGCFWGKETIKLLLNRRGNEFTITEDIIQAAAINGQTKLLDLLARQNAIISNWDKWYCISKFYNAAKTGDICCVRQLIHKVTDPDIKDCNGETPLYVAAAHGHEAVVKVLVQRRDVNVNSTSIFGKSPLYWPSYFGYKGIVAILMDAGADPHLVNKDGLTAVAIAREEGHSEVVKILERTR